MRAGDGLGDGGQRAIDLAFELQAMAKDFDLQDLTLVRTVEDRAGGRQAPIALGVGFDSPGRGKKREVPRFGRRQAMRLMSQLLLPARVASPKSVL